MNYKHAAWSFTGSSPLTRGKRQVVLDGGITAGLIPAHAGKTMRAVPGIWIDGAHPRSRGENALFSDFTRYVYGSSPLTRGKPARAGLRSWPLRLIPAHAGKTYGVEIELWQG